MKNVNTQIFRDSGWYRVDCGKLTVFWHVWPSGQVPLYSHGHNDICSFGVYWKGSQIITDPGRFSYAENMLGSFGKKASAHNTYVIDGLEPYPFRRMIQRIGRRQEDPPCIDCKETPEGFRLTISHAGFCRISKGLSVSREFFVTQNSVKITDYVHGTGRHSIRTFFHFSRGVEVECSGDEITAEIRLNTNKESADFKSSVAGENIKRKIVSGQSDPEPMGWYFPRYGEAQAIKTLIINAHTDFPYKAEHTLQFKD